METGRGSKKIYLILAAVFAVGFLACAVWLVKYLMDVSRAENQYDDIRNSYVQENGPTDNSAKPAEPGKTEPGLPGQENDPPEVVDEEALRQELLEQYAVPDRQIDFAALQAEENPDIYAWINIPDTKVDCPILQHPDELDYYLDHNVDHSKGYPGCIYSQFMNNKDFTDNVTVLYGHNMKNGTMFANLHFYEDSVFFEEHPYVYIYTPDRILVYQIFAAYEYHNGHILVYNDVVTESGFGRFIDDIYTRGGIRNQYNEDARPEFGDRVIVLSTCISGKAERRWLVSAVLRADIPAKGNTDETQ